MHYLKPLLHISNLILVALFLVACDISFESAVPIVTTTAKPPTATPILPTNTYTPAPTDTPTPISFTMSLPFDKQDPPYGLIPMGETVYHPKPQNPIGHPGIDFQWDHKAPILAAVGGTIIGIEKGESWVNLWDVRVRNGQYQISYTELESYNPELAVGEEIKVGTFIGYPQRPDVFTDKLEYRMFHWEFGYYTGGKYPERLCPMNYFDAEARIILENIWTNYDWEYKREFPNICSGGFENKNQ